MKRLFGDNWSGRFQCADFGWCTFFILGELKAMMFFAKEPHNIEQFKKNKAKQHPIDWFLATRSHLKVKLQFYIKYNLFTYGYFLSTSHQNEFYVYKIILELSQGREGKSSFPRCPTTTERLKGFKLAMNSMLILHPMLPPLSIVACWSVFLYFRLQFVCIFQIESINKQEHAIYENKKNSHM